MGRIAIRNVYVDYLLSTSGHISATDLSEVLAGHYSHDQISRMLYRGEISNKVLYLKGKRLIETKGGLKGVVTLSIDDSIQEKPTAGSTGWWPTTGTTPKAGRSGGSTLCRGC